MTSPFDGKDLTSVVDFASIIRNRSESPFEEDTVKEAPQKPDRQEMRRRLDVATKKAEEEIVQFRELVSTLTVEIDKLVLFKGVAGSAHALLIEYMLEQILMPLLSGNRPYGMPEDKFKESRKELFRDLMNRYSE